MNLLEVQLAVVQKLRQLYPSTRASYEINTRRYPKDSISNDSQKNEWRD